MPFVVAGQGAISDRGLAGAHGAVIPDGVALYRGTDGVDLGTAIPAHGTATIAETAPTQANAYDSYSAGGLFSIDTLDQAAGLARVDGGTAVDTALRGGNVLRGAFETAGGVDAASRALLDGSLPAAGGSLDLRNGWRRAGWVRTRRRVRRRRSSRRRAGRRSPPRSAWCASVNTNGPENDNIAALSLQSGHRHVRRACGNARAGFVIDGTGISYDERAFVQGGWDVGAAHVFASLALAQDGETLVTRASTKAALLPIFSVSDADRAGFFAPRRQRRFAAGGAALFNLYGAERDGDQPVAAARRGGRVRQRQPFAHRCHGVPSNRRVGGLRNDRRQRHLDDMADRAIDSALAFVRAVLRHPNGTSSELYNAP